MFKNETFWVALKDDRRCVTALEYGLIAGLIVTVVAIGFSIMATALSAEFTTIGNSL